MNCNTPILNWRGKKVLWLGTSIPQFGIGVDSYPELFGRLTGAIVTNMAWSGSHATWDINAIDESCATSHNVVKGLSASYDELQAKIDAAQPGSAYLPDCSQVTNVLQQSYEYRIGSGYDVVFLDHAHNDRVIDPALRDSKAGYIDSTDKATICGAWNFLIARIKELNPNAKIILMTAPTVWNAGVNDGSFQHIHGCLRLLADKWKLTLYDLCNDLNLGKEDTLTWLADGTHPTQHDQRMAIAKYITRWARGGVGEMPCSNTWIPTITPVANIQAITPFVCNYQVNDNIVSFFGQVNIDPIIAGTCQFTMSTPFPVDFKSYGQAAGIGYASVIDQNLSIAANPVTNCLSFSFNAINTNNQVFFFSGFYRL